MITKLFARFPLPICRLSTLAVNIAVALIFTSGAAHGQSPAPILITVDAAAARHPISPLIYGVNLASEDQLLQLNSPVNRIGGNSVTRYNWKNNSTSSGNDYFFESTPGKFWPYPDNSTAPSHTVDEVVRWDQAQHTDTLLTVQAMGWAAKVTDPNTTLYSFSVKKYGQQQHTDPNIPDSGNGVKLDGTFVTGNDPTEANIKITPDYDRPWIEHLVKTFGDAEHGGVKYYLMDNEPALWNSTHRDVHPQPETSQEDLDDIIAYGTMVKSVDPSAQVCAPDEWGYAAIANSGADNAYSGAHNYTHDTPDRAARGGMDNLPWLLQQLKLHDEKTGHRLLDVVDIHIYPQGADNNDDVSEGVELLRNRDTRSFWDPNYVDESWIKAPIGLIPRLKAMIEQYYPGTKIGITEYSWGAEKSINGATAQADLLGIFGREGVSIATRWIAPDEGTPVFKAMQMYRNYDGHDGSFGSIGVADSQSCNPDDLSSFAAIRRSDGALTLMVVNKDLSRSAPLKVELSHFSPGKAIQVYQLTAANSIARLPDTAVLAGSIEALLPSQSITLFVIPASRKHSTN